MNTWYWQLVCFGGFLIFVTTVVYFGLRHMGDIDEPTE